MRHRQHRRRTLDQRKSAPLGGWPGAGAIMGVVVNYVAGSVQRGGGADRISPRRTSRLAALALQAQLRASRCYAWSPRRWLTEMKPTIACGRRAWRAFSITAQLTSWMIAAGWICGTTLRHSPAALLASSIGPCARGERSNPRRRTVHLSAWLALAMSRWKLLDRSRIHHSSCLQMRSDPLPSCTILRDCLWWLAGVSFPGWAAIQYTNLFVGPGSLFGSRCCR